MLVVSAAVDPVVDAWLAGLMVECLAVVVLQALPILEHPGPELHY